MRWFGLNETILLEAATDRDSGGGGQPYDSAVGYSHSSRAKIKQKTGIVYTASETVEICQNHATKVVRHTS